MSEPTDRYERLLRAGRPAPRPEFVNELERRLLDRIPPPGARRIPRMPTVLAGVAFAAALGAVVVVLAVTGVLPFGLGRDVPVSATPPQRAHPCRIVVTKPGVVGREIGRCPHRDGMP